MGLIILLIFVGVPLIELSLLIEIGSDIGAVGTIALCFLTAGVGLSLIRMQGLKVMADIQTANASGKPLVDSLIHGFFLLIAGALLFFPGFMTDALGGLLLIPPLRLLLGRAGVATAMARKGAGFTAQYHSSYSSARRPSDQPDGPSGVTIDGEFWDKSTQEPRTNNPKTIVDADYSDPEDKDQDDPKTTH